MYYMYLWFILKKEYEIFSPHPNTENQFMPPWESYHPCWECIAQRTSKENRVSGVEEEMERLKEEVSEVTHGQVWPCVEI